jgi:hypothetical protein
MQKFAALSGFVSTNAGGDFVQVGLYEVSRIRVAERIAARIIGGAEMNIGTRASSLTSARPASC